MFLKFLFRFKSLIVCKIFLLLLNATCQEVKKPRIAIIGGGIAGASVVHFLEEVFEPSNVHLDLYEPNDIGGRLSTVTMHEHEFELGGAVIHSRNQYMATFKRKLGLKTTSKGPGYFAIFDGRTTLYAENSKWSFLNFGKFWMRYGLQHYYIKRTTEKMLSKFDRIYKLQEDGYHFTNTIDLLKAMNPEFVDYMQISTGEGFKRSGFSVAAIKELIGATIAVNYGQTVQVHQFVGSVSLAGFFGELYAIEGGNKQVPLGLLRKSSARIVENEVSSISLESDGTFNVTSKSNVITSKKYDLVILATPLAENTPSGIDFINFPIPFSFPGKYHKTVCTLVSGNLNYSYFNVDEQVTDVFCIDDSHFFSSIGKVYPVHGDTLDNVWKIFSHHPLTDDELGKVFTSINNVIIKEWYAYPHYSSRLRSDDFVLYPNLYHINAIEWVASAMEMSSIAAKNVALSAYENWTGKRYQGKSTVSNEEL